MTRHPLWLRIGPPLAIGGLAVLVAVARFGEWGRVWNLLLVCAFVCWLALMQRGRWRDASVSIATIFLMLGAVEAGAIATMERPYDPHKPGLWVRHPILGWSLGKAGTYHHLRRYSKNGPLIFEVDYTVARDGQRRVESASDGKLVAFFGDSMTFGYGLSDAETLPQLFADATGRRLRVLNLAMTAYGPHQWLRALETDMHAAELRQARLLVMKTAPWHAERTNCWNTVTLVSPRYVLEGDSSRHDTLRHTGRCQDNWWIALRSVVTASATFRAFVKPAYLSGVGKADIELYIAVLIRAGAIARAKYDLPTVILYAPASLGYLDHSGFDEATIMRRLRDGGLIVLDGTLRAADFPGHQLKIPGDGHPTGTANRAHANILRAGVADMLGLGD